MIGQTGAFPRAGMGVLDAPGPVSALSSSYLYSSGRDGEERGKGE